MENINEEELNIPQTFGIEGRVKIDIYNEDGTIKEEGEFEHNIVTNSGLAAVINQLGGITSTGITYLAVGTGTATPSATDTTLETELTNSGFARKAATVTAVTTSITGDTLQLSASWTATADQTIQEIGAFNAASSGIMLGRKLTGTKSINTGESINAIYQFQISRTA